MLDTAARNHLGRRCGTPRRRGFHRRRRPRRRCSPRRCSQGSATGKDNLAHKIDLSSSQPVVMKPLLGETFVQVPLSDWWEGESIFVHNGTNYTRKRIILSVANKDGSGHVDETLEAYYEVLCAGEYALGITGNLTYDGPPPFPQGVTIYPKNAHLALVNGNPC